tara:strand:+ start:59 stop:1459 length:1401 start_codon:yes stop_codon:yes gene_type:complete
MKNNQKHLCVLDDDKSIRWVLEKAFQKENFKVSSFEDAESILKNFEKIKPDIILSDVRMPGISGIDLVERLKREYPHIPIIIMTAFSDLETTVASLQKGAYEYLTKPFDIDNVISIVKNACENNSLNYKKTPLNDTKELPKIIGLSESMQFIYKSIGKISRTDVEVLILGETGTGKELIAKAIHENSSRKHHPFIAINTGAIPTELLESELFGHEKGSFTGAYSQRIGRFEQASDGTLFLDEIGDMPMDVQTRLLRVLQEGEFFRVGGAKSIRVKTRIITATHKNLQKLVDENLFREDLLHRINAIKIELPNLSERKSDISELTNYFMNKYCEEYNVKHKVLNEESEKIFLKYDWPGNIRELQNVCKYLSIMSPDDTIKLDDLPDNIFKKEKEKSNENGWEMNLEKWILNRFDSNSKNISKEIDSIYNSILIKSSLKISKGNKTEAAKILGWGRNTISNKMKSSED